MFLDLSLKLNLNLKIRLRLRLSSTQAQPQPQPQPQSQPQPLSFTPRFPFAAFLASARCLSGVYPAKRGFNFCLLPFVLFPVLQHQDNNPEFLIVFASILAYSLVGSCHGMTLRYHLMATVGTRHGVSLPEGRCSYVPVFYYANKISAGIFNPLYKGLTIY